jgi:hypothetical protein
MLGWVALVISLLAWFTASIALGLSAWVYFKGPRFKEFEIDDLYDALLEQNDASSEDKYKYDDDPRDMG